ncbi:MAG TPA: tetratricopeptide repeat protein [Nitrospira sp.]|nr:tetratricopeptide repeat protein [Nitrospira sp.]
MASSLYAATASMRYNDGVNRLIARSWSSCAVAAAITVASYGGVWFGVFHFDDFHSILENPHLESWRTFVGHLDHMVRPVLYVTLLFDRLAYGTSAAGYHALNLLLHLGSGCLIYRILSRPVTEEAPHVAFWTTLLFLVHPIQTETVTYISGRASGLMAFFYFLALCLYIEATTPRHSGVGGRWYLVGAQAAFVLALGSKETAATLPAALLLWDVLVRRFNVRQLRATFLSRHLPFWLILCAACGWAWWHPRYAALARFSLELRAFWDNALSQLHAGIYSLWLLLVPSQQTFDHDLPLLRTWSEWPVPVDLAVFVGMMAATCLTVRRLPLVSFGCVWYWLQLSPIMIIPRNDLLSERNLYLASFGILLAGIVLFSRVLSAVSGASSSPALVRAAAGGAAVSVALALCLATVQRNALYRDPLLLWSDAVNKAPQKARPHNNLGHTYAERGDWEQAIEQFRLAAQLDPEYWVAQDNLRDAYLHHVGRR